MIQSPKSISKATIVFEITSRSQKRNCKISFLGISVKGKKAANVLVLLLEEAVVTEVLQ